MFCLKPHIMKAQNPKEVPGEKNKIKTLTVGTESIQTPLNFSLFVILQPFAKII